MIKIRVKVSVLLFVLLFVQACAIQEKKLAINDFNAVPKINLVRHETPPFLKETLGAQAVAVTGIMFGAIGGGVGGAIYYKMMESSGKILVDNFKLEDFGELVFAKFSKRLSSEMNNWPTIETFSEPVNGEYKNESGFTLMLSFGQTKVSEGAGLSTITIAKMIDTNGTVIWQKQCNYESKKHERTTKLNKLEAENGKLLHEELSYAAEITVADFINHLKGSS